MIKKLLPIILLLFGAGAGVGAGMFLRPPPPPVEEMEESVEGSENKKASQEKREESKPEEGGDEPPQFEYLKMSSQFVVPIVKNERISALVVLSLSLEIAVGTQQDVYLREAKVRDSFLQVLFDHANYGGFDGAFTDPSKLDNLRMALREVAKRDLGEDVVNDVLILDIVRQDY